VLLAWIVKSNEPGTLGAPEIVPVLDSVSPGGRVPEKVDQVIDVGPEAESCCVKKTPATAIGNGEAVVIVNRGWIVSVKVLDAVCCGLDVSTTETAKLNVPVAVGIPLSMPSLEMDSPEGKPPELADHE
jgi:hypothetical protein